MGRKRVVPMLFASKPLSPNLPVFPNLENSLNLSFGFMWRLHYIGMID